MRSLFYSLRRQDETISDKSGFLKQQRASQHKGGPCQHVHQRLVLTSSQAYHSQPSQFICDNKAPEGKTETAYTLAQK